MTDIPPPIYPDDSMGRRYAKAFKYVFCLLPFGQDATSIDGAQISSVITNDHCVELVLPQQIQLREPFATVVTVMQDGGKVIESKGQVLKLGSVSGTTGLLPPPGNSDPSLLPPFGQLTSTSVDADGQLGAISGYLAFQRLRYLFRLYGTQRRNGNLSVTLHWFDYKNDDFWRIEPDSFEMTRSSRRPMSYDYGIQFKCIEPSDNVVSPTQQFGVVSGLYPIGFGKTSQAGNATPNIGGGAGSAGQQAVQSAVARFAALATQGENFLKFTDLGVEIALQGALTSLDNIVGLFEDANDTFNTTILVVPGLMAQLDAALANVNAVITSAPDNVAWELNEWFVETSQIMDNLNLQVNQLIGSQSNIDTIATDLSFSTGRMKQGATTDLMTEPPGSPGSPDANPFIGASGLGLTTDVSSLSSSKQLRAVIVNTGEDVYQFATRVLGSITRFVDVILLNKLQPPFIVSDPANKPSNTVAWGESLLVQSDTQTSTTIGDTGDPSSAGTTIGTVTDTGLPNEVIDGYANWLPGQWAGFTVTITTGIDVQSVPIVNNDSSKLTLSSGVTLTITPFVTTYAIAMTTLTLRRPVTADQRAYGRGWLVNFTNGVADVVFGVAGVVWAVGVDNLFQALRLMAGCPLGGHPFHPTYGLPAPVGRPFTSSVGVLYLYFMRRSLLSDPRVSKVSNLQLSLQGDTLYLNGEVTPIDARKAEPINLQIGT